MQHQLPTYKQVYMKEKKNILPTDAELEILMILWERKKATVREIYDEISRKKGSVYTTTLKIMQKMTAKGLIGRKMVDQAHIYYPLVEDSRVRKNSVRELITKFFGGSYSSLALHALGNSKKDENLDELVDLINQLKQHKK